jgi:hypothetical protein
VQARNRVAALSKHRPDSQELEDARRDLAEAKLADAIRKVVAAAPPLTAEQRNRLATLLMGGVA